MIGEDLKVGDVVMVNFTIEEGRDVIRSYSYEQKNSSRDPIEAIVVENIIGTNYVRFAIVPPDEETGYKWNLWRAYDLSKKYKNFITPQHMFRDIERFEGAWFPKNKVEPKKEDPNPTACINPYCKQVPLYFVKNHREGFVCFSCRTSCISLREGLL